MLSVLSWLRLPLVFEDATLSIVEQCRSRILWRDDGSSRRDVLRDLLLDLGVTVDAPSVIQSDSKSAIDMSLDPVAFKKTKHILRAAEFLRDLVARDVVRMQHLPGKTMVADLLTKAVARALFASLMDLIRQYAESGVACPST